MKPCRESTGVSAFGPQASWGLTVRTLGSVDRNCPWSGWVIVRLGIGAIAGFCLETERGNKLASMSGRAADRGRGPKSDEAGFVA
jgi:hypothetical protein